jgi:hypothetical protein
MNADWEKLERDIVEVKSATAQMRTRSAELNLRELERLEALARECAAELIALRSVLGKLRSRCAE